MVQIIEQEPSFLSQIMRQQGKNVGQFAGSILEGYAGKKQSEKENQAFKEQFGIDVSGMSPEVKAAFAKEFPKHIMKQKMMADIFGVGQISPSARPDFKSSIMQENPSEQEFLNILPEIERIKREKTGQDLTPQELDAIWSEMQASQPSKQKGIDLTNLSPEQKLSLAMLDPAASRLISEEETRKQRAEIAERKESHALAKPTLERGRELLEDLPYKENALAAVKDAIESGNLGMFSLDNLAEMTGIEGLRSPEGASFKTASKEFFLGNLSRVGSRGLNQMMERVVLEMAPLIGRSTEANLAVTEILGAENDVTRKEAELIHDIGINYKEKHGHYPEDLAHRVYKELRPYAQQRQKDALAEVEKIKQRYQPKNKEGLLMYDPAGNLRRVPFNNKKEALKEGYRMP